MKTLKLRIFGMHCEACERTLKRAIEKLTNITNVDLKYTNELAEISYDSEINTNEVIETVRKVGYDAKLDNKNTENETKFNHYINSLTNKKNEIEGNLIKNTIISLIILFGIELIAYYGFFTNITNFWSRFGYYLVFLVISVVLCAMAVWHVKGYGNNFSCMTGMMIGMTIGMSSGFLIGLVVGATNGMFIGSLVGIIIGMFAGSYTGKCCGAMGIMEGMMAGLMGGLMGAMTSLMMINDHLKIMIPILVIATSTILIGLDYLIYKETSRNEIRKINKPSLLTFLTLCFIITIVLTWIMIYGPKSILFQ